MQRENHWIAQWIAGFGSPKKRLIWQLQSDHWHKNEQTQGITVVELTYTLAKPGHKDEISAQFWMTYSIKPTTNLTLFDPIVTFLHCIN
jgi:hypothetical protein